MSGGREELLVTALDAVVDVLDRITDFIEPASDVGTAIKRSPEWDVILRGIADAQIAMGEAMNPQVENGDLDAAVAAAWVKHGRFHSKSNFRAAVEMVIEMMKAAEALVRFETQETE